jgi:hypothetical protein
MYDAVNVKSKCGPTFALVATKFTPKNHATFASGALAANVHVIG